MRLAELLQDIDKEVLNINQESQLLLWEVSNKLLSRKMDQKPVRIMLYANWEKFRLEYRFEEAEHWKEFRRAYSPNRLKDVFEFAKKEKFKTEFVEKSNMNFLVIEM